ncbi:MAG TPA: LacI family transcriptional regulator [Firmicutes bacterium]|nr:LacI family transcriptional regulator [Bacillota bacterium]
MGENTLTTIYDVAKQLGVSTATVSRVINGTGRVSEETRDKVKAIIAELGYQPNQIARTLTTKKSKLIGLIIADITNPFYPALARGVQDVCHSAGYDLLLCNTDEKASQVHRYVFNLCQKQVDGIILQVFAPKDLETIEVIKSAGIEVVIISYINDTSLTAIYSNEMEGAYQATRHLIDIGHQRVAFLNGPKKSSISVNRLKGYKKALNEVGIKVDEQYILYADFNQAGGEQMAQDILKINPPPTAIFAANDLIALGVVQYFEKCNIRIPNDIALVGFDDIELAHLIRPKLTTIANPKYELGQTAAQQLISRIQDPTMPNSHIVLDTRLVLRDSSLVRKEQSL